MSVFKPLDPKVDSLRVLVLHPGSGDDDIVCNLENRTFASKPVYEALSYTWGPLPAKKTIKVNGTEFLVRDHLYDALLGLRGAEPRYMWVDAVCINQEDVLERNYQVSLMAYIYTRARRVIAWLGLTLDRTNISDYGTGEEPGPRRLILENTANGTALASHPYWRRVWVVQELVLASNIEIYLDAAGHIGWDEFGDLVDDLSTTRSVDAINRIKEQRDLRDTDERRLEQLIDTFQDSLCSEPRDGVYGFLGMAHDNNDLAVDYHVGYYDLYAATVRFHQDAPFLNAEVPAGRFWLDEANDRAARLIMFSQLLQRVLRGAVERNRPTTSDPHQPAAAAAAAVYRARGALVGTIIHLGPTYAEAIGSVHADRRWKRALESHYTGEGRRLVRQTSDAYSRALEHWSDDRVHTLRAVDDDARRSYGYRWRGDDDDDDPSETPPADTDDDGHRGTTREPHRFLATQRVMGVAPPGARVGDGVCAFYGTDVHVIVRRMGRTKKHRDRWMIIGRADAVAARSGAGRDDADVEAAINFDLDQVHASDYEHSDTDDDDSDSSGRNSRGKKVISSGSEESLSDSSVQMKKRVPEAKMRVVDMIMNLRLDLHTLQQLTL